jgi:YqaJ-like viral recombinase domain
MKYRYDIKQGEDLWLQARLGIPTASEFDRIIMPAKLELSKSSKPYTHRLLAEWMYGAPLEAFVSPWMERGKELEPEAVRYYEMERGVDTQAVGIVLTDDGMIGASPDRLVGDEGLLELKCPALETHVGYMLDPPSLVADYRLQTQGQLWVCGDREWVDLMSYHPGFPTVIIRQKAEMKVFAALSTHLPAFIDTMLKCRELLTQTYGELRRERVTAQQRVEESRAAFDEFMESPIGGVV